MANATGNTSNTALFTTLNSSPFLHDDMWLEEQVKFYQSCDTRWTALVAAGGVLRWSLHLVRGTDVVVSAVDAVTDALKNTMKIDEVRMLIRAKSMDFIHDADEVVQGFKSGGGDRPGWRLAATQLLVAREELDAAMCAYSHMVTLVGADDEAQTAINMADDFAMNGVMVADLLGDGSLTDAREEETLLRASVFDDAWWLEGVFP